MKRRLLLAAFVLAAGSAGAADLAPMPALKGTTLDGRAYELAARRGRVVMVMLWRSDCAVCIDKLPELRANAQGWKSAPFDLVLINLDAAAGDAEAYEHVRRVVAPNEASVFSFWQGHVEMPTAWRQAARLPHTLLVDRQGALVGWHQGRVPPDAWNQVADLLP